MTRQKCVVIGGGIAGMTAALLLKKKGFSVSLVEKSAKLGITLRGFTRKGSYFDTGLHVTGGLDRQGLVNLFLRYLGIEDLPLQAFASEAYMRLHFADSHRDIDLPVQAQAFTHSLTAAFPAEEAAITDYVRDVQKVCQASIFLNLRGHTQEQSPPEFESLSLADYLAGRTTNNELKATLASHCLLHGVSPKNVSFAHHARIAGSYFGSAHTFTGGGKALVQQLEKRLHQEDIQVLCNNAASRVKLDAAGTIQGVELESGTTLDANTVVYTAHPAMLTKLFACGTFKKSYEYRLQQLEDTPSAHIIFGSTREPIEALRRRSLLVLATTNLEPAFTSGQEPHAGPFYACSSPQFCSTNETRQAITVISPGSCSQYADWATSNSHKRPDAYYTKKEAMLNAMHARLAGIMPEFENLERLDGASPLTLRDYMHTPTGSLYGCSHSLWQFAPHPASRVPGLWLAGQSVMAPGLMGAMASAFLTCGCMTGLDQLLQRVCSCR